MSKKVLAITELCIDCGLCRETCPFDAAISAFTKKHHYEIIAQRCEWCGGPGKAPCHIFCPVDGAIVPALYDETL